MKQYSSSGAPSGLAGMPSESINEPTTTVNHNDLYSSVAFTESQATATAAHTAAVSSSPSVDFSRSTKQFNPVEAVYANAIIFPDTDPSWYDDSNTPPQAFEEISDTVCEADREINKVYTCMAYTTFISLLLVILLLGVAGLYLGASGGTTSTTKQEEEMRPIAVVCYHDPILSRQVGIRFRLKDICLECCTHLVYDGLVADEQGNVLLRYPADATIAREMTSWLSLKSSGHPQLLVGLRAEPPTSFSTTAVSTHTLSRLHQSLVTQYHRWHGVAVIWEDMTGVTPNIQKNFFMSLYEAAKPTSFKVFAHITPQGIQKHLYDYDALEQHTTGIVVQTHDFSIPGRAYPPCSFEPVDGIASSEKQNWVAVINELVLLKAEIVPKLIPTVSTVGKKYNLSDPAQTDIGELVSGTPSPIPISEICANHSLWSTMLDASTKCQYGYNAFGQWIGFEGKESIFFKTELIKKRKFMGLALMNVEMDDDYNCNATVKNYLLSCIHNELHVFK